MRHHVLGSRELACRAAKRYPNGRQTLQEVYQIVPQNVSECLAVTA